MLFLPARPSKDGHIYRCLASIIAMLVLPLAVFSQGSGRDTTGTGGSHIIQGYVFFPSGRRAEGSILVKLQSYSAGELSVMADVSGSFTFPSLAPGSYTVVINAGEEYETARETVFIDTDLSSTRSGIAVIGTPRRYSVMIHLELRHDSGNRARASVINAALLEVPEKARQSYETGLDLARAGNTLKAVEHLRAAVSLYPKFPLALNELGVQYLRIGQVDKAAETLSRAVNLAPRDLQPRLNYGIALLNQRRYAEAEDQLRRATGIDNSAPTTHMYLGITLAIQRKLNEAERELQAAIDSKSNEVTLAHRYLGGVFLATHEYRRAALELDTYLKLAPQAADSQQLRKMIEELTRTP